MFVVDRMLPVVMSRYGSKELVDDHNKHPGCVYTDTCGITGGQILVRMSG